MDLLRLTHNQRGDLTSSIPMRDIDPQAPIARMFIEGPDLVAVTFDKGNDGTIRWERL